ncbi:hypothetical protein GN956_G4542 [Arapaima gigas]
MGIKTVRIVSPDSGHEAEGKTQSPGCHGDHVSAPPRASPPASASSRGHDDLEGSPRAVTAAHDGEAVTGRRSASLQPLRGKRRAVAGEKSPPSGVVQGPPLVSHFGGFSVRF